MNRQDLKKKVPQLATKIVAKQGYISAVDLFIGLGKLKYSDYENWRFKKVPYLEKVIEGNLNNLSFIMKLLRQFAVKLKLKPSKTVYNSWGKGPKIKLRFSKYGRPGVEDGYSTHYVTSKFIKNTQQKT